MKKFIAKVNGKEYVVELTQVEGGQEVQVAPSTPAPVATPAAPVATPVKAAEKPATPAPVASGSAGATKVEAPMPGTILSVKVAVGQSVKQHEVLAVLEAMKMENDIVAPKDGVVASVNVNSGQSVDSGQLLVSLD